MSKITVELKVDSIPFAEVIQEINQEGYSSGIMVRTQSQSIIFDKAEDLVRFTEFIYNYDK